MRKEKNKEFVPLPTGVDDFLKLRALGYFYVDKTLLIKDLLDMKGEVNVVFTRPRRFGKSLNISMLKYYFDALNKDDAYIFDGLAITKEDEKYKAYQNQYPVIILTMKAAEGADFEKAFVRLKTVISMEFKRHLYLLQGDTLLESEKAYFQSIIEKTASKEDFSDSLMTLSRYLEKHYSQKVIILIDEYDVPLEKAHFGNYYDEMIAFIRSFLGSALKTNTALYKAVLTGCLRISKESIFTGVNNLDITSIISKHYDEYFGFTEREVTRMFKHYGFEKQLDVARDWYNGYSFGDAVVYNPWSLIKYVKDLTGADFNPKPYWSHTSSNSIIRELIELADEDVKDEIEHLIAGGTLTKPIQEDIVYQEITQNMNKLWTFLFFTGYLKKVSETFKNDQLYYELAIPNKEVRYIYMNHIRRWFEETVIAGNDFESLSQAIHIGDVSAFENELSDLLIETISYFDSKEDFYHGFLSGVLTAIPGYRAISNRESGNGRADLFLKARSLRKPAYLIEVKVSDKFSDLEKDAKEALAQIETKGYETELKIEGYQNITKYGIAFYRKDCLVLKAEDANLDAKNELFFS